MIRKVVAKAKACLITVDRPPTDLIVGGKLTMVVGIEFQGACSLFQVKYSWGWKGLAKAFPPD
jgi:hypothetical protein